MIKNREVFKSINTLDKFWKEKTERIRELCKTDKYSSIRESLDHLEKGWVDVINNFRAMVRDMIGIEDMARKLRKY